MGVHCNACSKPIGRYEDYVECFKGCMSRHHIACVGITEAAFLEMRKNREVKNWKCKSCSGDDSNPARSAPGGTVPEPDFAGLTVSQSGASSCGRCADLVTCFSKLVDGLRERMSRELEVLKLQIQKKMSDDLEAFKSQIVAEFGTVLNEKIETAFESMQGRVAGRETLESTVPAAPRSYSSVVCDSRSFVVKPKNNTQTVTATKSDLFKKLNPVENCIGLARVKGIRDGGVVVSCSDSAESGKFETIATDKLSSEYSIREVSSLLPRIKIVGLSEELGGGRAYWVCKDSESWCFSFGQRLQIHKL